MSFWDNVKKFAQPYADDDYDDDDYEDEVDDYEEEEAEQAPAPRARRNAESSAAGFGFGSTPAPTPSNSSNGFSGTVLNSSSGKQEVVLFSPVTFNDVSKAADFLRARKAVVVNMEGKDKTMARRVVDFMSGCAYALDGTVKKIAQATYLFCPHNMEVTGDLENLQSEVESYV